MKHRNRNGRAGMEMSQAHRETLHAIKNCRRHLLDRPNDHHTRRLMEAAIARLEAAGIPVWFDDDGPP